MRLLSAIVIAGLVAVGCQWEPKVTWHPVVEAQGIDDVEAPDLARALPALLSLESVTMVFYLRDGVYYVHGKNGTLVFQRRQEKDGFHYEIVSLEGENPLARQDADALGTLDEELAAGSNPNQVDYRSYDPGYSGPDDPRMSFVPFAQVSFPLAFERIAALFDSTDAPDFVVQYQPYAIPDIATANLIGGHSFLDVLMSRAVLSFAGAGVKAGQRIEEIPRIVDVAPTLAKALGIHPTFGIDERGYYTHDVLLKWQDGHVLEEILDGNIASHVVIVSADALTSSELRYQIEETDAPLPALRWLVESGSWYHRGVIANFPSNTFAAQNSIGSGAWSGHHGLIDNKFYQRKKAKIVDPHTEILNASSYLSKDVETLHEAVHRSFGNWHPELNPLGNFTASLNNPSGRDADLSLLDLKETYDWADCSAPDKYLGLPPDPDFPPEQAGDDLLVMNFARLFVGTLPELRGGGPCTPVPRYVIVNFGLTDGASHKFGPHGDRMRRAIAATDQRIQLMFEAAREAGVFENTLWVLISDHGQALQDQTRLTPIEPTLSSLGLKFKSTMTLVYLMTMKVEGVPAELTAGRTADLKLTVTDNGTGDPVADDAGGLVEVESQEGMVTAPIVGGKVELRFTPVGSEAVLNLLHPVYSEKRISIPLR